MVQGKSLMFWACASGASATVSQRKPFRSARAVATSWKTASEWRLVAFQGAWKKTTTLPLDFATAASKEAAVTGTTAAARARRSCTTTANSPRAPAWKKRRRSM
jgi:hypothetical protein